MMRRRLTKVIIVMVTTGFSGTSRFLYGIHGYDRWSSIMEHLGRARHLVRRIRWTGSRTLNIVAHLERKERRAKLSVYNFARSKLAKVKFESNFYLKLYGFMVYGLRRKENPYRFLCQITL